MDAKLFLRSSSGARPVKIFFAQRFRVRSLLLLLLACALQPTAHADTVAVRSVQGSLRGFLEVSNGDGQVVASGDSFQVVQGGRVISRTVFHFKDGSIDDETTVYTQRLVFRLISDHHIQKGPSFPHPMDVLIEVPSGQVTVRSPGKDGKEEVESEHLKLPDDLANGLTPILLENLGADSATTTVSVLVAMPKPRLVKLVISHEGDESCMIAGLSQKAMRYKIKIVLGGIVGFLAPMIGKAPPDVQVWTIGGDVVTFAREQGPLYPEGPIMTIQLVSPNWQDAPKPSPSSAQR